MIELFNQHGITLSSQEKGLFEQLLKEFTEYNAHTNLSAIRDEAGIIEKHFIDSAILRNFETLEGRMLDIGTGGGFPGIPLKILFPELDIVLLDSVGKKIRACETFIGALGLSRISGLWGRAEDIAQQPRMKRGFDIITSRATAYMPQILAWAEPFLAPKGRLFLYKSPSKEELQDGNDALRKLSLRIVREHVYELAGQERKIFVIERR